MTTEDATKNAYVSTMNFRAICPTSGKKNLLPTIFTVLLFAYDIIGVPSIEELSKCRSWRLTSGVGYIAPVHGVTSDCNLRFLGKDPTSIISSTGTLITLQHLALHLQATIIILLMLQCIYTKYAICYKSNSSLNSS